MRQPQPSVFWGLLALPKPVPWQKTQASPSLLSAPPSLPLPHSHLLPDTAAQGSHRHGSHSREWTTLWSTCLATQAAILSQESNNLYGAHLGPPVPICPPFSCLGFFLSFFFTQYNALEMCFVFACSIANATLNQHVQEEFLLSFHSSRPVHS